MAEKKKAVTTTGEEPLYLRTLISDKTPVCVRLIDGSEVEGVIEYYDVSFIRVTRDGAPNLFIFKKDIQYLFEIDG